MQKSVTVTTTQHIKQWLCWLKHKVSRWIYNLPLFCSKLIQSRCFKPLLRANHCFIFSFVQSLSRANNPINWLYEVWRALRLAMFKTLLTSYRVAMIVIMWLLNSFLRTENNRKTFFQTALPSCSHCCGVVGSVGTKNGSIRRARARTLKPFCNWYLSDWHTAKISRDRRISLHCCT